MNKRRRCNKNHTMEFVGTQNNQYWWCKKCKMEYKMSLPEKEIYSATWFEAFRQGGMFAKREIRRALGI
jgi:hypothetical protein